MKSKIEEKCDEFYKSVKVDKNYGFTLGDRYFSDDGKELTFGSIYMAGARALLGKVEEVCNDYGPREPVASYIKDHINSLFEAGVGKEEAYPCAKCGVLRTKAEGGTTFTVCDNCWDDHYGSQKMMLKEPK